MSGSSGRRTSAGLLVYRWDDDVLEVLLVHPGGPFWARKDLGAWSIPKGEFDAHEDPLATARREFVEELGATPPDGPGAALGEVTQAAGKRVSAWAFEWPTAREFDPASIRSNDLEVEWPPWGPPR
jgi:predicted NUDIX family NTP pyrophosphohydrolase